MEVSFSQCLAELHNISRGSVRQVEPTARNASQQPKSYVQLRSLAAALASSQKVWKASGVEQWIFCIWRFTSVDMSISWQRI